MGSANPDRDVYTPPRSRVTDRTPGTSRTRFWATCLVCAVVLAILFVWRLEWPAAPGWIVIAFAALLWPGPVIWILFPELRRLGLKDVALLRFVTTSIQYVVTTAVLSALVFTLAMLTYTLVVIARDPSMLKYLTSPN